MDSPSLNQHLSSISTVWTVLRLAHEGAAEKAMAAQQFILERYGRAVYRYLLGAVRDTHAADELTQQFALDLIRGAFRRADPQRGRFRDYVKSSLFHLVSKHRKRQQKQPRPLPPEAVEVAAPAEPMEPEFDASWREELLARAWTALESAQPTFHAVLRFRANHPQMPSVEMAHRLGKQLGKALTADGVRQTLRRARDKYAELLLDEVAQSLEQPSAETVQEELVELNLLAYCRPYLDRHLRGRHAT